MATVVETVSAEASAEASVKAKTTKKELQIPNLNAMHNPAHIKASIILSRLPVSSALRSPQDVLIVSEEFSLDLFDAFAILLNNVKIYIVTPYKEEVKPRTNHATLGYVLAHTLNDALASRAKLTPPLSKGKKSKIVKSETIESGGFDLIICIAKDGAKVMRAAKKVIDGYLRTDGAALMSCPDDIVGIPDSYHILQPSEYIRLLFNTEDTIITIRRSTA